MYSMYFKSEEDGVMGKDLERVRKTEDWRGGEREMDRHRERERDR